MWHEARANEKRVLFFTLPSMDLVFDSSFVLTDQGVDGGSQEAC